MAEGLTNREVICLAGGLAVGVTIGYLATKTRYEQLMEEREVEYHDEHEAELKTLWNNYENAKKNWEKPELREVVNELGYTPAEQKAINEVVDEEEKVNVFEATEVENWSYEDEQAKRSEMSPGAPYIVHKDEFFENAYEYTQTTITYYSGDDVLADERDEVLEPRDHIVGGENLKMMGSGHGSGDPNVLYIRNERTDCDFEVINNPGKFSEEAMGFIEHSDFEPRRRGRLKFDDE